MNTKYAFISVISNIKLIGNYLCYIPKVIFKKESTNYLPDSFNCRCYCEYIRQDNKFISFVKRIFNLK